MNNKAGYIYMSIICSMFIIAPGRFACGIVLVLELLFLMLFGVLFKHLVQKVKIQELRTAVILFSLIFIAMLFRQLVVLTMPLMALQMGFVFFLPAVSTYLSSFLFSDSNLSLKCELRKNMYHVMKSGVYGIFVSLIRDFFGYGTITFIGINGMVEKVIFPDDYITIFSFVASIPGAFMLSAIILIFYILFQRMFMIIRKSGVKK